MEYSESKGLGIVFCTDYTVRNDAGGISRDRTWARNLDRSMIMKLVLADGQAPLAKFLKAGDYCRFRKMRLKQDNYEKHTIGYLGGKQDLMEKLRPDNKENKPLQALRRYVYPGEHRSGSSYPFCCADARWPSHTANAPGQLRVFLIPVIFLPSINCLVA